MRYGFTGSRPPDHWGWRPFTDKERELIASQVDDLLPIDEVGTGACVGVDELVMEAAYLRGLSVVSFVPGNAPGPQTTPHLREWSRRIIYTGNGPLERDQDLVDWSECMRAVPLLGGEPDPRTGIFYSRSQPRSGTWATVRMAQRSGKLRRLVMLRPGADKPPQLLELDDAGRLVLARHAG